MTPPSPRAQRLHPPEGLPRPPALADACLLVLGLWILLTLGGLLGRLGAPPELGPAVGLGGGALLAAATRRPGPLAPVPLGLGLAVGLGSHGAWLEAIAAAGRGLGWETPSVLGAVTGSVLASVTAVGLAPMAEELVYRERLLPALAARVGALPALLISSAAFALPHLEAWSLLASSLVGLWLGLLWLGTRSVALCIGVHSGLNLASLALASVAGADTRL